MRGSLGLALLLAALLAVSARAGQGLVVGVDDDTLKWTEDTTSVVAAQRELGAVAVRVTLQWQPGQTSADDQQRTYVRRAQSAARLGQRVVLSIFGPATAPPVTQSDQDAYCAFAVDALSRARSMPRRRDLERGQLGALLAAAAGRRSRVRGAAGRLLRRAPPLFEAR